MEYAYSEQVSVVGGECEVRHLATRDYLLKVGYEEIRDEELVAAGVESGGNSDAGLSAGDDAVEGRKTTGQQEKVFEPSHRAAPSKKLKKRR